MGQSSSTRRRRRPGASGATPKKGKYAKLAPSRFPFRRSHTKVRDRVRFRKRFKKIWRKLKRVNGPADEDQTDKMPLRRSRSLRSNASSQRSLRTSSSSRVGLSASRSTGSDLGAVEEETPLPSPKYERSFDWVVVVEGTKGCIQDDLDGALKRLLPKWEGSPETYPTTKLDPDRSPLLWFKLGPELKKRIFELCFPPEDRRISLSMQSFTEAIFPVGYFALPQEILEPVEGLLESCRALRKDTLAYFFSQYRFHITLNEFTSKLTCPLSHAWVVPYLHFVQDLTIERDYTRLAGSNRKNASQLSWAFGSKKVTSMVDAIVDSLLKRENGMQMAQFHLMARKYQGLRPKEGSASGLSNIPYVPDDVEFDISSISRLEGVAKRCRVSGFTRNFTKSMFRDLFAKGVGEIHYCAAKDHAWPGHASSPLLTAYSPSPKKPSHLSFQLDLPSHHEVAWAKELQEELGRFGRKCSELTVDETVHKSEQTVHKSEQIAHRSRDEMETGDWLDILKDQSPGAESEHTCIPVAPTNKDFVGGSPGNAGAIEPESGSEIICTKVTEAMTDCAEVSTAGEFDHADATYRVIEGDTTESNLPDTGVVTSISADEFPWTKETQEELDQLATELSSDESDQKDDNASAAQDITRRGVAGARMLVSQSGPEVEGAKNEEEESIESGWKSSDTESDQSLQVDVPLGCSRISMQLAAEEIIESVRKPSDSVSSHDTMVEVSLDPQAALMKPAEEEVEASLGEEDQNYTTAPATSYGIEGFASCGGFDNTNFVHRDPSLNSSWQLRSMQNPDPSIPRSLSNNKILPETETDQGSELFPDFVPNIPLPTDSPTEQSETESPVRRTYTSSSDKIRQITGCGQIIGCEKTIAARLDAINAELEQNSAFQRGIKRLSESQPQSQYESSNNLPSRTKTLPHQIPSKIPRPIVNDAAARGTWRSMRPGRKSLFGMFGGFNGARTPPAE
ncbi:uncharacterized protein PAC_05828 [Phialocephala subalpina]|uniref:Uncharacterized protein n=1 Tax=Phialocephala subalpina TaxID=576137 RepID=A0A1L7WT46_9HELO|nr:uncharacterized protein PAC_05828 [Phialocephala subalpina]